MKVVGHRGAKGLAPENTLVGFRKALEHGVDAIEFDVRVTKDHVPALAHDARLHDASGGALRIADYTHKQLLEHKPDLTTLDEALDYIDTKVAVHIEVKPGEPVEPIAAVVSKFLRSGMYTADDILIGSKSQSTLRKLHAALPDVPKIVIEPWSGVRAHYRARQVGSTTIAMNQLWLWSGFIRAVSRGGWQLYAYPMNDRAKAKHWAKYGLAGVVTDYPDRFRS